jgi:hypothetical protein
MGTNAARWNQRFSGLSGTTRTQRRKHRASSPSLFYQPGWTLPNNVTVANSGSGNPATIGNDNSVSVTERDSYFEQSCQPEEWKYRRFILATFMEDHGFRRSDVWRRACCSI